MAFSFLYLAFRALLGALVRSRRGLDVKDVELLVLRHELEVPRRRWRGRPFVPRIVPCWVRRPVTCRDSRAARAWSPRGRCCGGIARWRAGGGGSRSASGGARPSGLRCGRSCCGWLARIPAGAITNELAVMWDTFRPLRLTTLSQSVDNPAYAYSWNEEKAAAFEAQPVS